MRAALWSQSRLPRFCGRVPVQVAAALLAGLGLRLWLWRNFFLVNGDALVYGGIAANLLRHGGYALSGAHGELYPTIIRLPGYPFFLAAVFRLCGLENYAAVAWVQIGLALAGCLLVADCTAGLAADCDRRHAGSGFGLRRPAALAALWLAALCPFTAIYEIQPLSEGPTFFAIALALASAVRFCRRLGWGPALGFTAAVTFAALLRPDGALLGLALAPALLVAAFGRRSSLDAAEASLNAEETGGDSASRRIFSPPPGRKKLAGMALVCLLLAMAPFALWTARNALVFQLFEPLAPRLANEPGEDPHLGWERWVKSWSLDFISTYEVYWNVPGDRLELAALPERAFDSPTERAATAALAEEYNLSGMALSPELDARFGRLAEERARAHPWRTHLWLPLGRVADMWFRPRNENLPVDLDWWDYAAHPAETRLACGLIVLNFCYLLLAAGGLALRPRLGLVMAGYLLLRSALLTTIAAPEARYTLEFFPFFFVLGGFFLGSLLVRRRRTRGVSSEVAKRSKS